VLLKTPRFEIVRARARFAWLLNGWTSRDVGFVAVEQRSESLAGTLGLKQQRAHPDGNLTHGTGSWYFSLVCVAGARHLVRSTRTDKGCIGKSCSPCMLKYPCIGGKLNAYLLGRFSTWISSSSKEPECLSAALTLGKLSELLHVSCSS
jgi:hypothetical protein